MHTLRGQERKRGRYLKETYFQYLPFFLKHTFLHRPSLLLEGVGRVLISLFHCGSQSWEYWHDQW